MFICKIDTVGFTHMRQQPTELIISHTSHERYFMELLVLKKFLHRLGKKYLIYGNYKVKKYPLQHIDMCFSVSLYTKRLFFQIYKEFHSQSIKHTQFPNTYKHAPSCCKHQTENQCILTKSISLYQFEH